MRMSFSSLFGRRSQWPPDGFRNPWEDDRIAIFDHISSLEQAGTDPNAHKLQDDPAPFATAAGDADVVAGAIGTALSRHDETSIAALYNVLLQYAAVDILDAVLAALPASTISHEKYAVIFEWLARKSPDREPIKFAIGMLGAIETVQYKALFLTLGSNEAFAKYAGIAFGHALPFDQAYQAIHTLARKNTGWSRIELVDLLARKPNQAFRQWIVREGFRTVFGNRYLALIAAQSGDLRTQLQHPDASQDVALLDGTADLFVALINQSGDANMAKYDDGAVAITCWFDLIADHPTNLRWAVAAKTIFDYVTGNTTKAPWSKNTCEVTSDRAVAYLARNDLKSVILAGMSSGDEENLILAHELSALENINGWEMMFAEQTGNPSLNTWYELCTKATAEQAQQVIALAIAQTPLKEIDVGPNTPVASGVTWENYPAMFNTIGYLGHNKAAWPLVKAGLRSPHIKFRINACNILFDWGQSNWPEDAHAVFKEAKRIEPDNDLQKRMHMLLHDRTLYARSF